MWTKIKRSEEGLENASKSQGIQEAASQLAQKLAPIAATDKDFSQELSVGLVQFIVGSYWNALSDEQSVVLFTVAADLLKKRLKETEQGQPTGGRCLLCFQSS